MRVALRASAASLIAFSLVVAGFECRPSLLRAADESPSAFVMLTGSDELLKDGQYVLGLTNPVEQKQWPVLKSYLEAFLIAVDPTLPTQIVVIFDAKADRYVWSVPVTNLKDFRKLNLGPILTDRFKEIEPNLYQLGNTKRKEDFHGFLFFAAPYTHIGETKEDVLKVVKDPRPILKPLLDRHFDIAVDLRNTKTDAAAQAKRREIFQTARKKSMSAIKKDKGENAADFDLRKQAADVEMDEAEWFFSEAEHGLVGVTIDRTKGIGRVDLELTPIAGSPLADAIGKLGTKASYFANIEKSSDPILAARLNHPLSEVRKKTATSMAGLLRNRLKAQADQDQKLNAEQKEAMKQIVDKLYELTDGGIKQGLADGFIDAHKAASGKNAFLAGMRTADGTKLTEILSLVPKAGLGAAAKLDVAEESGVKIHSIELSKDAHPHWNSFIGSDLIYVGASKDAVWLAAGEGALDALKGAIKKTTQPAAAGAEKAPWAEFVVRLKPWLEQAAADLPAKKGEGKYRKLALSSFETGDDQLSIRMTRQPTGIVGEVVMQTGILRFGGKLAADFSKENLDESSDKSPKEKKSAKN
jgi:hypothetical protein